MKEFLKNTLVKDRRTGKIFIVTGSYYKLAHNGNRRTFQRVLMYKCAELHLPSITQIRMPRELTEIK